MASNNSIKRQQTSVYHHLIPLAPLFNFMFFDLLNLNKLNLFWEKVHIEHKSRREYRKQTILNQLLNIFIYVNKQSQKKLLLFVVVSAIATFAMWLPPLLEIITIIRAITNN